MDMASGGKSCAAILKTEREPLRRPGEGLILSPATMSFNSDTGDRKWVYVGTDGVSLDRSGM